ncbi:hypothetical protein RB195_013014 [Necator americanus]|uniref:Uncharacterized protein n=1 Tax=Necator americanus TaxID=51031 RepID=A0ABR1DTJ9_NECAM
MSVSKFIGIVDEVFCFIEGVISSKGHLNGTLHSCEPALNCTVLNENGPHLDSTQETIKCMDRGFFWEVENQCSFTELIRKSYCYTKRQCYGLKVRCPNRYIILTSFTETALIIVGLVLLSAATIIIIKYACRSRRINVAAFPSDLSETSTVTKSDKVMP